MGRILHPISMSSGPERGTRYCVSAMKASEVIGVARNRPGASFAPRVVLVAGVEEPEPQTRVGDRLHPRLRPRPPGLLIDFPMFSAPHTSWSRSAGEGPPPVETQERILEEMSR
jgi:hypothetical protein